MATKKSDEDEDGKGEEKETAEGLMDKVAGGVSVTIHDLLRYSCGGILFWLIAAVYKPDLTKAAADALGAVPLAFTALALGATAYVFCRALPMFFLIELWRWEEKIFFLALPKGAWSRRHFFESLGVRPWFAQAAWRVLRDAGEFDKTRNEQFRRQHSECHIPYVASVVAISSAIGILALHLFSFDSYAETTFYVLFGMVVAAGIVAFVVALMMDAQLSYQEGSYFRTLPESKKVRFKRVLWDANIPMKADAVRPPAPLDRLIQDQNIAVPTTPVL